MCFKYIEHDIMPKKYSVKLCIKTTRQTSTSRMKMSINCYKNGMAVNVYQTSGNIFQNYPRLATTLINWHKRYIIHAKIR